MRRCVRGDICVQGDAARVKEAASLLTSLVSQNTSMMTLVPSEKRAPRGTESLEVVESPTYRGSQASICSSLLLLPPLHRGVIKIQAYLNDSRKHWICWKRVGCGQLGDLLYTLVPTLHQFLARRQCEIKRTQKDNCVSNCCPNCAPLETTAMIFHLFMIKKQGGTECQPMLIASL
ncbi:unnamed protein product [Sphagnum jensenii]|uniref:Uncharacterized protein n=1 Tax=Sphagnum jensenii TaxID=128206 RepID=A0ABP1BEK1_9BRYO